MRKTLIVIDMQHDFVDGPLGTQEALGILDNVKRKIEAYQRVGDEIIFTRDTHYMDYLKTAEGKKLPVEHCMFGSSGWEVYAGLETPECRRINKNTFGWNRWDLRCDKVEIIGVCTDICVISNALIIKTMYPEMEIVVDASCCAGTTPENHKAALTVMKSCQIDVIGE